MGSLQKYLPFQKLKIIPTMASTGSLSKNLSLKAHNLSKKSAVLYHYPCPDGAFAALAAHLYFEATALPVLFFPNTVYNPVKFDHLPLHEITHLYLLDFVGPPGFISSVSSKVDRVIILDHHKTALEMLGSGEKLVGYDNVFKIIDMGRSGATIAFDYFKEKLLELEGTPNKDSFISEFDRIRPLFDYIEDGDLWRWKLKNSKAFSSGLKDLDVKFDALTNPSLFQQLLSLDLESVINQGSISLSVKQKLIEETLDQSYVIELGGGAFGRCLAVDADSVSELRSELGHLLATKSHGLELRGIGAVVYRVSELADDNKLKISLRSLPSEDTTPISQEFGGGGHRNASSFMINVAEFDKWKVGQCA